MSRIRVVDYEKADGRLKEIYDDLLRKRGKLANVHAIQSLRPETIVHHMDLYMEIMYSKSELKREEREMLAVVCSVYNQCHYCQMHHSEALNRYWKSAGRVETLREEYEQAVDGERQLALCQFAHHLTMNPGYTEKTDFTERLRKVGLSDEGILDATLIIAYFNFVNRIVLSLGLSLEEDGGKNYKY